MTKTKKDDVAITIKLPKQMIELAQERAHSFGDDMTPEKWVAMMAKRMIGELYDMYEWNDWGRDEG